MTILLKNQSLTGQISLKASWGVQKGPRGSARWQATPGPEGGLGLHPACRDALLVGRVGSSDPPHLLLLPPPSHHLHPPSLSAVPPREAATEPHRNSDTSPEDALCT